MVYVFKQNSQLFKFFSFSFSSLKNIASSNLIWLLTLKIPLLLCGLEIGEIIDKFDCIGANRFNGKLLLLLFNKLGDGDEFGVFECSFNGLSALRLDGGGTKFKSFIIMLFLCCCELLTVLRINSGDFRLPFSFKYIFSLIDEWWLKFIIERGVCCWLDFPWLL